MNCRGLRDVKLKGAGGGGDHTWSYGWRGRMNSDTATASSFWVFTNPFLHVSEHSHRKLMCYFILHWRLWFPVTPQEGWQQWGRLLPAALMHPEPEPLLGVQGETQQQHKLFLKSCQCETHWNGQKYRRTGTFKRKEWRLMLKISQAPYILTSFQCVVGLLRNIWLRSARKNWYRNLLIFCDWYK